MPMLKPYLIGLSGPSCSGKSRLADELEQQLGIKRFRMDAFYKNVDECPEDSTGERNWELPESYHLDQMFHALQELKKGESVEIPVYTRQESKRVGSEPFDPSPMILAEGLQLFADSRIRSLFDLLVWLDIPEWIALERRMERQPDYRMEYHEQVLVPALQKYVLPQKQFADRVLDGSRPFDEVLKEMIEVCNDINKQSI